jgi:predicted nuclease with TOPRIM domain
MTMIKCSDEVCKARLVQLQSQVTRLRDECERLRAENARLNGIIERATEITPLNCKELLKTLDEVKSALNQPKGEV